MFFELPGGPFRRFCLFAHCFATNSVLAGITDAAFKKGRLFPANHTSFFFFGHGAYFTRKRVFAKRFDATRFNSRL